MKRLNLIINKKKEEKFKMYKLMIQLRFQLRVSILNNNPTFYLIDLRIQIKGKNGKEEMPKSMSRNQQLIHQNKKVKESLHCKNSTSNHTS